MAKRNGSRREGAGHTITDLSTGQSFGPFGARRPGRARREGASSAGPSGPVPGGGFWSNFWGVPTEGARREGASASNDYDLGSATANFIGALASGLAHLILGTKNPNGGGDMAQHPSGAYTHRVEHDPHVSGPNKHHK